MTYSPHGSEGKVFANNEYNNYYEQRYRYDRTKSKDYTLKRHHTAPELLPARRQGPGVRGPRSASDVSSFSTPVSFSTSPRVSSDSRSETVRQPLDAMTSHRETSTTSKSETKSTRSDFVLMQKKNDLVDRAGSMVVLKEMRRLNHRLERPKAPPPSETSPAHETSIKPATNRSEKEKEPILKEKSSQLVLDPKVGKQVTRRVRFGPLKQRPNTQSSRYCVKLAPIKTKQCIETTRTQNPASNDLKIDLRRDESFVKEVAPKPKPKRVKPKLEAKDESKDSSKENSDLRILGDRFGELRLTVDMTEGLTYRTSSPTVYRIKRKYLREKTVESVTIKIPDVNQDIGPFHADSRLKVVDSKTKRQVGFTLPSQGSRRRLKPLLNRRQMMKGINFADQCIVGTGQLSEAQKT